MTIESLIESVNNFEKKGCLISESEDLIITLRDHISSLFQDVEDYIEEITFFSEKERIIKRDTYLKPNALIVTIGNYNIAGTTIPASSQEEIRKGILLDIQELSDSERNQRLSKYEFFIGSSYCFCFNIDFDNKKIRIDADADSDMRTLIAGKVNPTTQKFEEAGYSINNEL